jgi:hypothetical protein
LPASYESEFLAAAVDSILLRYQLPRPEPLDVSEALVMARITVSSRLYPDERRRIYFEPIFTISFIGPHIYAFASSQHSRYSHHLPPIDTARFILRNFIHSYDVIAELPSFRLYYITTIVEPPVSIYLSRPAACSSNATYLRRPLESRRAEVAC